MNNESYPFRIAFIGAQCTGKTTLCDELSKLIDLPVISEIARNYNIPESPCIDLVDIQKCILTDQINAENANRSFISDRSTIDNLAYWLYNCHEFAFEHENNAYIMEAVTNAYKYTHLFYTRPEFEMVDDGFRSIDKQYQHDIDQYICVLLKYNNIRAYLLKGTVQERLNTVLDVLKITKK